MPVPTNGEIGARSAERPAAACSIPSRRGSRHRYQGTESSWRPRYKLLGGHVHVLDFRNMLQHEVTAAGIDPLRPRPPPTPPFSSRDQRWPGDDVLVFFPRREVIAVGFKFGSLFLGSAVPSAICRASSTGRLYTPSLQDSER